MELDGESGADAIGVVIRPATSEDYERIVEVWTAAGLSVRLATRDSAEAFRIQLASFPTCYLVAEDAGRIVGVVLGTHDTRKGWINRLAVAPHCRNRGVGSTLVSACEAALRRIGIEIITVLIEPDNEASRCLFQKLGFREDVPVRYLRKLDRPDA